MTSSKGCQVGRSSSWTAGTGDPAKDATLRDHTGMHEANVRHMVASDPWKAWMAEVVPAIHNIVKQEDNCVLLTFCKSGRRRSVGNGASCTRCWATSTTPR